MPTIGQQSKDFKNVAQTRTRRSSALHNAEYIRFLKKSSLLHRQFLASLDEGPRLFLPIHAPTKRAPEQSIPLFPYQ